MSKKKQDTAAPEVTPQAPAEKPAAPETPAMPGGAILVKNVKPFAKGNLLAFADVEVPLACGGAVVLRGVKLLLNKQGDQFVGAPSRAGRGEGEFFAHFLMVEGAAGHILKAVKAAYEAAPKAEAKDEKVPF